MDQEIASRAQIDSGDTSEKLTHLEMAVATIASFDFTQSRQARSTIFSVQDLRVRGVFYFSFIF